MSGLEAHALESADYRRLEAVHMRYLRKLDAGRATISPEDDPTLSHVVRASSAEIRQVWQMSAIHSELTARRLKMWQSVSAHVQDFEQVIAIVLGRLQAGGFHQASAVDCNYFPTLNSNPWCKQLYNDLTVLSAFDPWIATDLPQKGIAIIFENSFQTMDTTIVMQFEPVLFDTQVVPHGTFICNFTDPFGDSVESPVLQKLDWLPTRGSTTSNIVLPGWHCAINAHCAERFSATGTLL